MKDFNFWLDCVLGTGFIFGLIALFVGVSQFAIFDVFDPVGNALGDMEMTDPVFSQIRADPGLDTNIVVVNIGYLPRSGIARQIEIINKYDPKVIAMDMFFLTRREDTLSDLALANALSNVENLVMVSELLQSDSLHQLTSGSDVYDSMQYSHPIFMENAHSGFANLNTEAEQQEDFKTCRSFPPKMYVNDEKHLAFGVKIAELVNPEKAQQFLNRNNEWEIINYRGNVLDYYGRTNYPQAFYVLDVDQVLNEEFVPGMIKDKIVLFGFHGQDLLDTSWDDKFFTPLNKQYVGKANPDMYGVVVHANIVSMILHEKYVETLTSTQEIIIAVIVCFLNVVLFTVIYRTLVRWYDGLTKLFQLVEIMVLVFIMIMFFHWFSFKLDLTLTVAAVALSGDSLEVFYGVVKNLFNREERRRLFTIGKLSV